MGALSSTLTRSLAEARPVVVDVHYAHVEWHRGGQLVARERVHAEELARVVANRQVSSRRLFVKLLA